MVVSFCNFYGTFFFFSTASLYLGISPEYRYDKHFQRKKYQNYEVWLGLIIDRSMQDPNVLSIGSLGRQELNFDDRVGSSLVKLNWLFGATDEFWSLNRK